MDGLAKRILGFVLLSLFHMYDNVRRLWDYWCERAVWSFVWASGAADPTHQHIKDTTRPFGKLPKHMGIILASDDEAAKFPAEDLARVVTWCMVHDVQCLSIYDCSGNVKRNHHILEKELAARHAFFFGKNTAEHSYTVLSRVEELPSLAFDGKATEQHKVLLLSADNGRNDVVAAARRLCVAVERKECTAESITRQMIEKNLAATAGLPDPEVALVLGPVKSLDGFLPWQSRLTEIYQLPRLRGLPYTSFLAALQAYDRCVQRLGK
eukprot:comp22410_c0_seq1/m.33518 comp22410_c0_seq1/g.33518  ORF comp22410_c0_seq1/g.33518 comp22410_c0_seq1/m.33518 type:complete len:267 (-) comp22410_c0_seq1:247-1047(-)